MDHNRVRRPPLRANQREATSYRIAKMYENTSGKTSRRQTRRKTNEQSENQDQTQGL